MKVSRSGQNLVRKGGFEPPRLSAPPPQDGVSASSTTSARGSVDYSKGISVLYDGREGFRVQAGTAHQSSINLFFRHQAFDVLRFNRTAVQDAKVSRKLFTKGFGRLATNQRMSRGGELGRGCLPSSDGPHRFVGDDEAGRLLA